MMSESKLSSYINITTNRTHPRQHKIDVITPHCYVGQVSVQRGVDGFKKASRAASCQYVIGYDGQIGQSVSEADRAWTSGGTDKYGKAIRVNGYSGGDNDHRAVTIEIASDSYHPYKITAQAYEALIKLMVDICQRNGIEQLKWEANKSLVGNVARQNVTVHRWFANKACPGDYIYEHLGEIVAEVNNRLKGEEDMTQAETERLIQTIVPQLIQETINKAVPNMITSALANQTAARQMEPPADWAQNTVALARDMGIMDGSRPQDYITRQEAVKLAFNAKDAFTAAMLDNDAGEWSEDARRWATENGFFKGIGTFEDGTPNYAWESPVSREQMAVLLYRLGQLQKGDF